MAKKVAKKKVSKKTTARKAGAKSANQPAALQDYAQEIWLAGLGAFALAQDEGKQLLKQGTQQIEGTRRKVVGEGSKLFNRLVSEGERLHGKSRKAASAAYQDVRGDVEQTVGKVRSTAQSNWDKLEKVFEQRVAKALGRLGVPTAQDVRALSDHVAELNRRVSALAASKSSAKAKAPAAQAKAPSKVAKKASKKVSKKRSAKKATTKNA